MTQIVHLEPFLDIAPEMVSFATSNFNVQREDFVSLWPLRCV
ncbi:hypothetical protein SynSYN20_03380 [Synechococcus sp. SYN20]|nr:hypothetical protein SynSYN20_03380 [Synechococcus sp. SYN20]